MIRMALPPAPRLLLEHARRIRCIPLAQRARCATRLAARESPAENPSAHAPPTRALIIIPLQSIIPGVMIGVSGCSSGKSAACPKPTPARSIIPIRKCLNKTQLHNPATLSDFEMKIANGFRDVDAISARLLWKYHGCRLCSHACSCRFIVVWQTLVLMDLFDRIRKRRLGFCAMQSTFWSAILSFNQRN